MGKDIDTQSMVLELMAEMASKSPVYKGFGQYLGCGTGSNIIGIRVIDGMRYR